MEADRRRGRRRGREGSSINFLWVLIEIEDVLILGVEFEARL